MKVTSSFGIFNTIYIYHPGLYLLYKALKFHVNNLSYFEIGASFF